MIIYMFYSKGGIFGLVFTELRLDPPLTELGQRPITPDLGSIPRTRLFESINNQYAILHEEKEHFRW